MVWAYATGTDFDIAFAEWNGAEWSGPSFLTDGLENELDPRVFVEADGTIHVVWWSQGVSEEVNICTRQSGSLTWEEPQVVTLGSAAGRRPAVAVFEGTVFVAYERSAVVPGMAQDIMIATSQAGGGFTHQLIGSTTRAEALDVVLHVEQGRLWADWKHQAEEFGSAGHEGGAWTTGTPTQWVDPSWIGAEETRRLIRGQMLD